MSRFGEVLRSGRVLLMDGAMGTELQRAGMRAGECYELWNVTHPERVRAIHQAYVAAGAEVLLTNTFQANADALRRHGLDDRVEEINGAAVELARAAAGPGRFVLASVGPETVSSRQMAALVRAGADALVLETFSTREALARARRVRESGLLPPDVPLLLSLTYERSRSAGLPCTRDGQDAEVLAEGAREAGVDALGVNCGRDMDPESVLEVLRRYRRATDLPLFARPNAGTPTKDQQAGERLVYPHTPEGMAARLPDLLAAGAGMVGGCCGTTPEHIAAFRPVVAAWNAAGHSRTAS
jgi:5-methyltetrahydrofolate--homocysteine methyltransferase